MGSCQKKFFYYYRFPGRRSTRGDPENARLNLLHINPRYSAITLCMLGMQVRVGERRKRGEA